MGAAASHSSRCFFDSLLRLRRHDDDDVDDANDDATDERSKRHFHFSMPLSIYLLYAWVPSSIFLSLSAISISATPYLPAHKMHLSLSFCPYHPYLFCVHFLSSHLLNFYISLFAPFCLLLSTLPIGILLCLFSLPIAYTFIVCLHVYIIILFLSFFFLRLPFYKLSSASPRRQRRLSWKAPSWK